MKKVTGTSQNTFDTNNQSELWSLFIKGDTTAFHSIYSFHYQMLYNFGIRFLDPTEVEDCIHDTFLTILKYKNLTTEVKNVKAYLFKSFRNQIYKIKSNNHLRLDLIEGTIPNKDDDPNKELILNELKQLIKKLSPRESEIIYLKYFQNFNNFEISEMLDIKYQTVRNILAGAIKKLRTLGEDYTHLFFLLFNKPNL